MVLSGSFFKKYPDVQRMVMHKSANVVCSRCLFPSVHYTSHTESAELTLYTESAELTLYVPLRTQKRELECFISGFKERLYGNRNTLLYNSTQDYIPCQSKSELSEIKQ